MCSTRRRLPCARQFGPYAVLIASLLGASSAAPQDRALARPTSIAGIVTTQAGTITLAGASVTLTRGEIDIVATTFTGADGRFTLAFPVEGRYRLTVGLPGFQTAQRTIDVGGTAPADVSVDLEIERVNMQVDVAAHARQEMSLASSLAPQDTLDVQLLRRGSALAGDTVASAMSLMPGVIATPAGLSIRGGRPTQSNTLLDGSSVEDPFTGLAPLTLPVDAVASVAVLPNAYAVEFGGFSSGLSQIITRQGTNAWQLTLNNFDPTLRASRENPLKVAGIRSFAPRVGLGGPIIKDKLFLAESVQYRYTINDVLERPESELSVREYVSSVTRVDAVLSPGHTLSGTLSLFPEKVTAANLDKFNPFVVTFDQRQHIYMASLTDMVTLTPRALVSSTVSLGHYTAGIDAQGAAAMEIRPEGNRGNYFNTMERTSEAFQWTESMSWFTSQRGGDHMVKVGGQLTAARAEGTSRSRPVLIYREDGTLASATEFGSPTTQNISAINGSVFVQDRWQPLRPLMLELGARVDRDGLLGQVNLTPRVSAAFSFGPRQSMMLRAGVGIFYERAPLNVQVFDQLETQVVTQFARDGTTPLGPPAAFRHVVEGDLRTPHSRTWNIAYDVKLSSTAWVRVGHLDRIGRDELIVNVRNTPGNEALVLSSGGRSRYVETEISAGYSPSPGADVRASYVRSSASGDLNAYGSLFGSERDPLVRPNQSGPLPADVPNRLVLRAHARPGKVWFVMTAVEWRSGFPYSAVNQEQQFVGARNRAGRFPSVAVVDVAVERQVHLFKWTPWLGLKVTNVLNTFTPHNVQNNVDSPAFGDFYNTSPRRIAFIIRLER